MESVILAGIVGALGVALMVYQARYRRKQRKREFEQQRKML